MIHNPRTSARFAGLMVDPINPARMIAPPEGPAAAAAPDAPEEDAALGDAQAVVIGAEEEEPAPEPAEDAPAEVVGGEDPDGDFPGLVPAARGRGAGGRGRGRPRNQPAQPPIATFDKGLPLMDFSLTVVSKGQHVPPLWLRIVYEFCLEYGERGLFALERGGNAEHLHVQAVVSLRSLTDTATCEKIKKMMKDALQVKRGDGKKWCVTYLAALSCLLRAAPPLPHRDCLFLGYIL